MGLRQTLRSFLKGRTANLPVIVAFALIPMTLGGGAAIDFVHFEQVRTSLQDTLDRGVLAAASLTQTKDPEALIRSYLKSVTNLDTISLSVTEKKAVNSRKITATVEQVYEPAFLKLAGYSTMTITAASSAEESRSNIEMSLVLDISGSMYDNGGIFQLRPAAKSFLDIVLKPELKNVTSVNIIPFAGMVNLGAGVFEYMGGWCTDTNVSPLCRARRHVSSSCFEFADSDFSSGMPTWTLRDQVPHFTYYNYNATGKKPWWCPTDDASVSYMTNDIDYLKTRIDALQPFDGTGTAYGMKWAELLLNPSMRSTLTAIANKKLAPIPSQFIGRPVAFSDADTLKFIVLMTDGQIGFQPRPKDPTTNSVTTKNISGSADNRVVYTEAQSVAYYNKVCAYTKAEGITVFTIAFKVSASVAAGIATCASDPSYAYKVDGLDMASAFQSIATTMQKIRLVN